MVVIHEMIVFKENIKTCSDLAYHIAQAIDRKSDQYGNAYVIFDNYNVKSLKENTRQCRTGGTSSHAPEYRIDNNTRIRDFKKSLTATR